MSVEKLDLRCSLVYENTLLEERVFSAGCKVSIGQSSKSTYTLAQHNVGRCHNLLICNKTGAVLTLLPGMRGEISYRGKTQSLQRFLEDPSAMGQTDEAGQHFQLSLGDSGVLVFGRVGLSFDFVEKPAKIPPYRVVELIGANRTFSTLFGCSLAVMMLLVLVSRLFAAPKVELSVEQLPDRFVSFIADSPESAKAMKKEFKRRNKERTRVKKEPGRRDSKQKQKPSEDDRDRKLRKKIASKGLVGAISRERKKKSALSDLLDEGGLGMSLNDAVKSLEQGATARVITSDTDSNNLAAGLIARRGTSQALGEGLIESSGTSRTGQSARRAARNSRLASRGEAAVRLSMPAAAATVTGGILSKQAIAKVVQRNKGAIRYCYESQLTRFPTLRGKVIVDFIIEQTGAVSMVNIPEDTLTNKTAAR